MGTKETKRLMIFIDGSNLYHASKRASSDFMVDYVKLIEKLKDGRDLIRTYFYGSSQTPPIQKQMEFHTRLQTLGIQTTIKPLRNNREKGIDVALVTDLLIMAYGKTMDVAVIVSGDQDFVPAIAEVKRQGITVEAAMFRQGFSQGMQLAVDKTIFLNPWIPEIGLPNNHSSTSASNKPSIPTKAGAPVPQVKTP